jgi:HSP20 family protein
MKMNKVYIKMAMPGVKKEDIKITIEDDQVRISGGSKKEEESDKKRRYYYRSMESSFEQIFNLPCKVDSNKADAEFKDGVVNVTLPKEEAVKPKEIEIK